MNDFEELQKIYEGYRGQSFDPIKPPNSYPAQQDWGPYSRPIPGSPEASGYSQFRQNQGRGGYIVDEEKSIEEKDISNKAVLEKIAKLIDEAEEHEMTYAIHALGELREHIITLSR